MMEYRRLGASGLTVPLLSFGAATFGGEGTDSFSQLGLDPDVAEARRMLDVSHRRWRDDDRHGGRVFQPGLSEKDGRQGHPQGRRDTGLIVPTKGGFQMGSRRPTRLARRAIT